MLTAQCVELHPNRSPRSLPAHFVLCAPGPGSELHRQPYGLDYDDKRHHVDHGVDRHLRERHGQRSERVPEGRRLRAAVPGGTGGFCRARSLLMAGPWISHTVKTVTTGGCGGGAKRFPRAFLQQAIQCAHPRDVVGRFTE